MSVVGGISHETLSDFVSAFQRLSLSASMACSAMQDFAEFYALSFCGTAFNGNAQKCLRYLSMRDSDDKRKRRRARRWLNRDKQRSVKNVEYNA